MNYKRLFSRYFWKDLWYKITAFFNPRQKWLTKHIPNTWKYKPELIQDILFACLIDYVEEEKGLHDASFYEQDLKDGHLSQEYYDHSVAINNDLREAYNYIKMQRPVLESKIIIDDQIDIVAWLKAESTLNDKDIWAMTVIVKYSKYLWT
jgi:hypothetical protein